MNLFHNTTGELGQILKEYNEINGNQNRRVMDIFLKKGEAMTPMEVMNEYNSMFKKVPLTSIRRAMTDLTKEGRLIKTDKTKIEALGKRNFMWVANSNFKNSKNSLI
jgi:Fe2+ or Zn2+ uptake regulation protein